jgi:hypothetical protein
MLRTGVGLVRPSRYLQMRMVPIVCMLVLISGVGQMGCIPAPAPSPYGDGSAGDLVVAANGTLFTGVLSPGGNPQFRNFTVNAGIALNVPSGTVIRCTGSFTNNGTINVQPGSIPSLVISQVAGAGISNSPAGNGQTSLIGPFPLAGGVQGAGLFAGESLVLLEPDPRGGGGGGSADIVGGGGGSGGGMLTVLARGAITNVGTINADGDAALNVGGGGGGGGVVILASPASISNSGLINARGGTGGNNLPASNCAGGGGGGGGLVHLLSPDINAPAGTVDVSGGPIGTINAGAAGVPVHSGGGGGGSAGQGGTGAPASPGVNGVSTDPNPGANGQSWQTLVDPTDLFF